MAKTEPPASRSTRPAGAPKPVAPARTASVQPAKPAPRNPPPVLKETRVKVRATRTGYYDHARRHPGDVFVIDGKINPKTGKPLAFSEKWMEFVDARTPQHLTTAQGAIDKKHDEILGGHANKPTGDLDPLGADGE